MYIIFFHYRQLFQVLFFIGDIIIYIIVIEDTRKSKKGTIRKIKNNEEYRSVISHIK